MDLLAAAAGQPTSRELTPLDLEKLAKYKKWRRDLLFQPPCECKICHRQYNTKDDQNYVYWHYFGHTEDPASLAQSFAKAIKQDRDFLYHKILESAPALLKRWRSRGEAKRKEILVTAQPDMYPYSQPLIDITSREKKLQEARKHRSAYLLPYINIEDLSKDSVNFIRLLHHRTTYPPQDWVHFDNAQLQPGWMQGGFEEKSAEGCVMMCDEEYGTWKDFDRIAVHRGDAYGAIRGLLILEAQQRLMSFLRKMVTTILKDASASGQEKEASDRILTSVAFPRYDLTPSNKWTRFVEADMHRDKPWLSVASLYTQQPYSTPPSFDIDVMIEIAETKAMEAADELWLLQTDPEYFHELMRRHEREWFDSIPKVQALKSFSPKEKAENIGYAVTVNMAIQARDWGWILKECQTLKIMGGSGANICPGDVLPLEYTKVLCGLEHLLLKAQSWSQTSLSQLFIKSRNFHSIGEVIGIGKDHRGNLVLGFNFKDYPQLYEEDRLGWCLYNLAKDVKEWNTFERSLVLQHLEKFLEICSPQDRERIDHEMYKCISDMAAVERMLSILELHRPNFGYMEKNPFHQSRQAWLVHSRLLIRPLDFNSARLDLDSTSASSANFRMPTGRRDEQWLTERDRAQQNLGRLWKRAKDTYQRMLEASEVPPNATETQLAMMKQGDSLEYKAQLDLEKRQILSHLEAARQRTLARSMVPHKDTPGGFLTQPDHPADRTQKPAKEKAKTRPDSASASLHTRFATAFKDLVIDEEIHEAEKPAPILYTLERESITRQVISLMFPDRSNGIEERGKTVDWLEFVSTMNALGFGAEHRGGSAFAFKGAIKLPHDPSTLHKRSISVHMPHPSTEMGPILLQSLGRRCNRRFGWQRGNFAVDEKAVDHGK